MKTIVPNIWMLSLRVIFLGSFIYMYHWPLEKLETGRYHDNEPIFWLGLSAFTLFPLYICWTLLGVLWVTISSDFSTIRFHYLYKTVNAKGSEVSYYYNTVQRTKVSIFKGFLVKLESKNIIEVSEYNLKSVNQIGSFLSYNKAQSKGDKDSWFPFKRRI